MLTNNSLLYSVPINTLDCVLPDKYQGHCLRPLWSIFHRYYTVTIGIYNELEFYN